MLLLQVSLPISSELQMSNIESLKIFAPATIANVGSGYDIFSIAINVPGDIIEFVPTDKHDIQIINEAVSFPKMPLNPDENACTVPMKLLMKEKGLEQGFRVVFKEKIRPGSGLGSSAASSCAGVYYLNRIYNLGLSKEELVNFAREGERVACGSPISDNVAACLNGGFNLIRSQNPLEIVHLDFPTDLYIACVHPEIEVLTSEARAVLPDYIPVKLAVEQWAQTATLVAGMAKNDLDLISKGTKDYVVEPHRKKLISGFETVKSEVLKLGALNCSISGAGPTLFSFCRSKEDAELIAVKMKEQFATQNVNSDVYVSTINSDGIKVI